MEVDNRGYRFPGDHHGSSTYSSVLDPPHAVYR